MTSIKMQIIENTDYTKCIYFPNSLSILSYTSRFIIGRNLGQIQRVDQLNPTDRSQEKLTLEMVIYPRTHFNDIKLVIRSLPP